MTYRIHGILALIRLKRFLPEFEMPRFKYLTHIVINMFEKLQIIYLAGGCFWGVEAFVSRLKGVNQTEVGYANGHDLAPTYEKVCSGKHTIQKSLPLKKFWKSFT